MTNGVGEVAKTDDPFLVFRAGATRFAVALPTVRRVYLAVEIEPLPGAPTVVAGVVNIHGEPCAVLDLRSRLPRTPTGVGERLVVVATPVRTVALLADEVLAVGGLRTASAEAVSGAAPRAGLPERIGTDDAGIVHVYDIERLLSCGENEELDRLLADWTVP